MQRHGVCRDDRGKHRPTRFGPSRFSSARLDSVHFSQLADRALPCSAGAHDAPFITECSRRVSDLARPGSPSGRFPTPRARFDSTSVASTATVQSGTIRYYYDYYHLVLRVALPPRGVLPFVTRLLPSTAAAAATAYSLRSVYAHLSHSQLSVRRASGRSYRYHYRWETLSSYSGDNCHRRRVDFGLFRSHADSGDATRIQHPSIHPSPPEAGARPRNESRREEKEANSLPPVSTTLSVFPPSHYRRISAAMCSAV